MPAQATADFLDDRFASIGKELGTALGPLLDAIAGLTSVSRYRVVDPMLAARLRAARSEPT